MNYGEHQTWSLCLSLWCAEALSAWCAGIRKFPRCCGRGPLFPGLAENLPIIRRAAGKNLFTLIVLVHPFLFGVSPLAVFH